MNNIINVIEFSATIIGLIFTIIIVNDIKLRIIICLSIFIAILCIKMVSISNQKNRLKKDAKNAKEQYKKEEKELQQKLHNVIKQYNLKKKQLDVYNFCWGNMGQILEAAIQNSKEERFEEVHRLYLDYTYFINKED